MIMKLLNEIAQLATISDLGLYVKEKRKVRAQLARKMAKYGAC